MTRIPSNAKVGKFLFDMNTFDNVDILRTAILAELLPQDAVLDLSGSRFDVLARAVPSGTKLVSVVEGEIDVVQVPCEQQAVPKMTQSWIGQTSLLNDLISALDTARVQRLLVLPHDVPAETQSLCETLGSRGIETIELRVLQATKADDFMLEEDAEAVATRLRQLGYL